MIKGLTADRVFIDETLTYPIKTQISGGYGTIPVLYDRIAQSLGLPTDKAHYDCTKIEVSCEIQDQVFSYYKKEKIPPEMISMWWLNYGPKINDSLQATQVLVQEGWYKYEGE